MKTWPSHRGLDTRMLQLRRRDPRRRRAFSHGSHVNVTMPWSARCANCWADCDEPPRSQQVKSSGINSVGFALLLCACSDDIQLSQPTRLGQSHPLLQAIENRVCRSGTSNAQTNSGSCHVSHSWLGPFDNVSSNGSKLRFG
jgi:hypothetical protein